MVAAQKQPDLYPLEAWALARLLNGMDVDPNIKVRPHIFEVLSSLSGITPKSRELWLRGMLTEEQMEGVRSIDFYAPAPNGRHKVPPARALKVEEGEPGGELETGSGRVKPTDDELGDQLIGKWGGQYAYIFGQWHRYEAGVWNTSRRNALEFWKILIENKGRGIRPSSGKVTSVESYCSLMLMVEEDEVDKNQGYINLQNGLFNLDTGRMEPHRPELYLTSQLPFSYDARARCAQWEKFLEDVLVDEAGKPDEELITLMQEAFGYSLTAYTHLRASFWCVGPSGSGKSTLLKVLINLSGSGHLAIDLDAMKDNQYQLAEVAGKRLVTFTEPDARSPLADGQYKRLVSSDTVSARQIHGKPFNFTPECKLWGAMNDTPRVLDRSDAVYGRIIIFPMLNAIPKEKWDLEIDEKLRLELPGIFNWAIAGWNRLKERGQFSRARASEAARDEYKAENDAEHTYVEERLERGDRLFIKADDLYQDYRYWCDLNGFKPKNRNTVSKDWKRLGLTPVKKTDANYYLGARLKDIKKEDIPF